MDNLRRFVAPGYGDGEELKSIVHKAVISIIDMPKNKNDELKTMSAVSAGSGGSGLSGLGSSLSNLDALSARASGLTNAIMDRRDNKKFEVQFNPESLVIQGVNGRRSRQLDSASSNSGTASLEKTNLRITLSVDLIFNKVFPDDAFLEQRLMMGQLAQGNVGGAIKRGMDILKGKDYSVQKEVEGLLSVCRVYNNDSLLCFSWGNMMYAGVVESVRSEYKMFNPAGEPIYGIVSLTLILASGTDENVMKDMTGNWLKAYKEAFDRDSFSMNTLSNKIGSYMNL